MKRVFLVTVGLLGIGFPLAANSTLFTHNLNYTAQANDGTQGTLSGLITFDSTFGSASDHLPDPDLGGFVTFNSSLITAITFTYQPAGGQEATINENDIIGMRLQHATVGSTDYSAANIVGQFTILQFRTANNGSAFRLLSADDNFALQAGTNDDFDLSSTTYHSPGPLPLFGLFTAFSSIKRLKSKYKRKYNL